MYLSQPITAVTVTVTVHHSFLGVKLRNSIVSDWSQWGEHGLDYWPYVVWKKHPCRMVAGNDFRDAFAGWDRTLGGRGVVGSLPATTEPRDLLSCSPLMVETMARSRG